MKKNNSSSIFFVTILLITLVSIFTTWGLQANAATMEKNLYTLENPTWMRNQGLSKGIDHDRQDLGVILPKNATIEIRQTNPNFKGDIRLELLNDDNQTESSYTVGNSWVEITASSDSVPFIKTTFTDDAPTVEYKVSDTAVNLPVFKQGDNENVFFDKWDATGATFGLVGNKYIQILVPVRDKFYLKKMDDFNSINALLAYYDTLFETFNELEGISFTPKNATDKNIPNRYFAKADKHGAGAAYYGGNYTAETSSSVISFWLKPGWGGLHEIAHGYQGNFMSDTTFNTGEVWNNLYADSMQKKMMGNAYYNGWLYEGNIAKRETTFEKSVYTTKTPVNNWDEASKLYMLTLMKDMAGDQAFTDFNQAYRADANTNNLNKDALILDLLTKYFGETSHYDFTAFVELVQGSMSDNQKVENLYSGNKAVYPLASLLSGNNLKTARKDINLDTKWGLVSNAQIDKYKLSATTEVTFSINDFAQIEGKVLRVKDGTDVVREVTITSPTVTLKNMPIGIYSLDIPTGITRFYEPSTNYLAVTDYESSAMIAMNEIQTSTFAENKMVFKGLGDSIFAIATVDPEKGNLELNVTSKRPHSYFENEYASIEVLDEQGNSAFKRVMDGNGTETGKFQVAIKPNYIIKIMHKEPSRFSIIGAPINLVHQATEQTFNVSKYGLTSDVTKVTDQDALVSYKSKLVSFAETVTANFKNEDYAAPKTKLKRGIDYLSDTDVDKIEYQQTYADLLALKNDISQDLLDGNQFRFQMNGLSDWNFANVRVNLDTNKAIITQNTGEPHWYFEGTYATVKINNAKGKEIFKKDFNGRGKVTASESNVIIAVGDFITLTHLESSGRLLITNEQTGKGYASYQTATYLVTASGLKKSGHCKNPNTESR
ncbi:putative mucin/carbohydrate-binding domain-containing protein [Listeria rocourtiae]|uniref:putative mucin/carbohydrate-binding domain-containing protein n=1 Tax=Listeria rocourtiae TaxID=647910 RepID=UPI0003E8C3A3|nr:putative mucin/carbohydrate-binding domain-containing protein [Listeria rocourtiae]EUJ44804.1 putative enhancing factor (viral) [Listeria rocourtiae FSL F6-920]